MDGNFHDGFGGLRDLLRIHELRARWNRIAIVAVGLESLVASRGIAVGKCRMLTIVFKKVAMMRLFRA